ncbi:hypothetical protein GF386_06190 [Candidatus Pacearchaeota archaeon]|nr:hypothetical protein [Candidatus Pacearchaeota archaeon]MBD3283679.1 hypothetical protein [Candidatus Pacearchaeota archaeon]
MEEYPQEEQRPDEYEWDIFTGTSTNYSSPGKPSTPRMTLPKSIEYYCDLD